MREVAVLCTAARKIVPEIEDLALLDSVCILGSKACMAHMTEDVKQDHDELMA